LQQITVRDTAYSQWVGHAKVFEREPEIDSDLYLWDACVLARDGR